MLLILNFFMTLNVTEVNKYGITGDRHCPFQLLLDWKTPVDALERKKKKHEI